MVDPLRRVSGEGFAVEKPLLDHRRAEELRLQELKVAGEEILPRDKVSLRINLNAGYRVSDVLVAYAKQAKPVDFLYKELQFGLRGAVGTRTLDEVLENKGVIDEVV